MQNQSHNDRSPNTRYRYRADRRAEARESYPVVQRLSFGRRSDGTETGWYFARCHDLSQGGLSFWSNQPLPAEGITVELGVGDDTVAVPARVRHVNPITCIFNELYLVGCEFVPATELTVEPGASVA